jgi:hypothetical protein
MVVMGMGGGRQKEMCHTSWSGSEELFVPEQFYEVDYWAYFESELLGWH